MSYVDGFVLAVPKANKEKYRKMAEMGWKLFQEFGALRHVECWGDDVPDGKLTDFRRAVQATADEVVVFSWIEYPSKEVRDEANKKIMSDPRMKEWGDHMAALKVPIVWGIGRHGPGNDVFFMVRDPDGNLAEISSEIEHCAPGRPAGTWPHEERTLNLWGKAILRS